MLNIRRETTKRFSRAVSSALCKPAAFALSDSVGLYSPVIFTLYT